MKKTTSGKCVWEVFFKEESKKLNVLNIKRDSVTKVLDVGWECKRRSRKDGQETDRVEKNDGEQLMCGSIAKEAVEGFTHHLIYILKVHNCYVEDGLHWVATGT